MAKVVFRAKTFAGCERGTSAVEYAVIAAGIAVAIVSLVYGIGEEIVPHYTDVRDGLRALE